MTPAERRQAIAALSQPEAQSDEADVSRETCPECGGPDERHTRGCRACHARYMRRWRAGNYIYPFERDVIRWLRELAAR